jgi:hypothetical protein
MRSTDWDKVAEEYFEHIDSPFSRKGARSRITAWSGRPRGPERKRFLRLAAAQAR